MTIQLHSLTKLTFKAHITVMNPTLKDKTHTLTAVSFPFEKNTMNVLKQQKMG